MLYSKATLQYLRHNIFRTYGMTLLPAILLGIIAQPLSMMEIIVSIGKKEQVYDSFIDIYRTISYLDTPWRVVSLIVAILISVVFVSMVTGYTRQKMRYGTVIPSKNSFVSNINDNFIPVFKYMIMLTIVLEIIAILLATFLFTTIKLMTNALPLCIIFTILFIILGLYFTSLTFLVIPNMTMKGYGLGKAISMSIYSLNAKSIKVFFAVLWIFIIMCTPLVLLITFPFKNMPILLGVFSTLFYWVIINYMSSMMYVVYFDVEELEREDLKGVN